MNRHRSAAAESIREKWIRKLWNHAMFRESILPENFWMWTESAADIICSGRGPAAMLQEEAPEARKRRIRKYDA